MFEYSSSQNDGILDAIIASMFSSSSSSKPKVGLGGIFSKESYKIIKDKAVWWSPVQ